MRPPPTAYASPLSIPSLALVCSRRSSPPTVRRHPSRSAAPLPPWTAPSMTTSPTPALAPQHETCHNVTTSNPQERLGQRRVARCLRQPPTEGPQHLALDLRVLVEHAVELPAGQHEQAHGRLGRHRRRARQLRDQGDLTHEVAATQRRDPPALAGDLHLAVDEHEELLAGLALLAEDL